MTALTTPTTRINFASIWGEDRNIATRDRLWSAGAGYLETSEQFVADTLRQLDRTRSLFPDRTYRVSFHIFTADNTLAYADEHTISEYLTGEATDARAA